MCVSGGGGGGVLICQEKCHYHANDFSEETIITNNRYLNPSPRLSVRKGGINRKLLSVYENSILTSGERPKKKKP